MDKKPILDYLSQGPKPRHVSSTVQESAFKAAALSSGMTILICLLGAGYGALLHVLGITSVVALTSATTAAICSYLLRSYTLSANNPWAKRLIIPVGALACSIAIIGIMFLYDAPSSVRRLPWRWSVHTLNWLIIYSLAVFPMLLVTLYISLRAEISSGERGQTGESGERGNKETS